MMTKQVPTNQIMETHHMGQSKCRVLVLSDDVKQIKHIMRHVESSTLEPVPVLICNDSAAVNKGLLQPSIQLKIGIHYGIYSASDIRRLLEVLEPQATALIMDDILVSPFQPNFAESRDFIRHTRNIKPTLACVLHSVVEMPEGRMVRDRGGFAIMSSGDSFGLLKDYLNAKTGQGPSPA